MSQKAVFVRIDGNLIPEVFDSVPDYNRFVEICKEHGFIGDETPYDYYRAEYEWINIGEGESESDHFIDDETLLAIYDSYDYARHIYEALGYNVRVVESRDEEVMLCDILYEE